ncbi:MAG: LacI family transcriptional regulator [Thermoanaerobaculia bacterium]|nr:LacI family transcriptional regulator [Thermoanaerobaculia bacterium]
MTLKDVASHAGVSTATVSLVINQAPAARAIPQDTQDRVRAAARLLNYRPNLTARSLRNQKSHTIGVLLPEVSDSYNSGILTGLESHLLAEGYFYFVAGHRIRPELFDDYVNLFRDRQVDGFVLINTPLFGPLELPTVAVAGHEDAPGVMNVIIEHRSAARAALGHLAELGHREIAVFQGHPSSGDTEVRLESIREAAVEFDIDLPQERILQLTGAGPQEVFTPEQGFEEGYALGQQLLEIGGFSALFAFNDVSAIGAMRAFLDAGLDVPDDVSVVGFDDIQSAAFFNPSLTTVRQPLEEMGRIAGRALLDCLRGVDMPNEFTVEPELVVRKSTGPSPGQLRRRPDPMPAATDLRTAISGTIE